jgi:hypothetical protein
MSEERPLDDLSEIESALASLAPREGQIDRDRLMFRAGQAAARAEARPARARRWAWPAAFSTMTAVAAAMLMALILRPEPRIIERLVPVSSLADRGEKDSSPPSASSVVPAAPTSGSAPRVAPVAAAYPQLLARVLERGLDAWPPAASASLPAPRAEGGPASFREYREQLLGAPSVRSLEDRPRPGPFESGAKS